MLSSSDTCRAAAVAEGNSSSRKPSQANAALETTGAAGRGGRLSPVLNSRSRARLSGRPKGSRRAVTGGADMAVSSETDIIRSGSAHAQELARTGDRDRQPDR